MLEPLADPTEGSLADESSIATRFTMDREEAGYRDAEKWVTRPLGPQPRSPWRVVVCVADLGLGYNTVAVFAGALKGMAEVTSIVLPGRLHRASEPRCPLSMDAIRLAEEAKERAESYEPPDDANDATQRPRLFSDDCESQARSLPPPGFGFLPLPPQKKSNHSASQASRPRATSSLGTNEDPTTELGVFGVDARNALAALGFFDGDDQRPWMIYGHGLGAIVAYNIVIAQVAAPASRPPGERPPLPDGARAP